MSRASGLFLHITSLPSCYGIGDLGHDAHRWINLMADSGQKMWQLCPLGPVGDSYSPYMTLSTFAGNPMLISPDLLQEWGYLSREECHAYPSFSDATVQFTEVAQAKDQLMRLAFTKFKASAEYEIFCQVEAYWLDDYVLFMSIYKAHKKVLWTEWPTALKDRDKASLAEWEHDCEQEISYERFLQFMFNKQWKDIQKHAHDRGVKLFGDVPIYVAYNSADVWANREIFQLDADGVTQNVGGVPPDYFSEDGQLWGNPLYDWDVLREQKYDWWVARLKRQYSLCDIVRIDHFRALEAYWSIPGDSTTAKKGKWVLGPGHDFFKAIKKQLGNIDLIAEDLGIITEEVNALRDGENLPGMKVLQFAFDGNKDNWYIPYNVTARSVMYSGTHDNDTTVGWYNSLDQWQKDHLCHYLACATQDVHYHLLREVMASVSELALFPLQDILYLGSEARFNVPGTIEDNWAWRVTWEQCEQHFFDDLKNLTELFGRL